MIPLFKVFMSNNVIDDLKDVLLSGYIGQGDKVNCFEYALNHFLNVKNVLAVNSGTAALTLAIRLAKTTINPSSTIETEVLTTPLSHVATNWSILQNNLKIKWVDVSKSNGNIDLDDLHKKISMKTRIIMITHLGGLPVDLNRLRDIQIDAFNKFGMTPIIIEDAAQAFGSEYRGKKIGSHGNMCCFSFQAIKSLTSGDGGLLVTPDREMYEKAKLLRWFGMNRESGTFKYLDEDILEWGYKFNMNDINAAIGLSNLPFIDGILDAHRSNAEFYSTHLRDIHGVKLMQPLADSNSSYWLYMIRVQNRARFIRAMESAGITVSKVHSRNDLYSVVKKFKTELPNLDSIMDELICIPVGWWVGENERTYIVERIKSGW